MTPAEVRGQLRFADGRLLNLQPVNEHAPEAPAGLVFVFDPYSEARMPASVPDRTPLLTDDIDGVVAPPDNTAGGGTDVQVVDSMWSIADTSYYNRYGSSGWISRVDLIRGMAQGAYTPASITLRTDYYGVDFGIVTEGKTAEQVYNDFKTRWPMPGGSGFEEEHDLFSYTDFSGCYVGWGGQQFTVHQEKPDACHAWTVPVSDHDDAVDFGHEVGHVHNGDHNAATCTGGGLCTIMFPSLNYAHEIRFSNGDASHNNLNTVTNFGQAWNY